MPWVTIPGRSDALTETCPMLVVRNAMFTAIAHRFVRMSYRSFRIGRESGAQERPLIQGQGNRHRMTDATGPHDGLR